MIALHRHRSTAPARRNTSVGRAWMLAACLMASPLTGAAEATANARVTLNLQDAIKRTLAQNPGLKAYGYQHEMAAGQVVQANQARRPQIGVTVENVLGTGDYTGADSAEATLSISWVADASLRAHKVAAARADAAVVVDQESLQRLDAAAETARYYVEVLACQTRLKHAQESIQSAQDAVNLIKDRFDAGVAPAADLAQAETALAQRKLMREDIEHRLLVAKHRLAAQWDAAGADIAGVSGDVLQLPKADTFEQLKARASQNPALAVFASQQRVYESELALARAATKPQWQFTAGIRHLAEDNDQALMAGVSIPLGSSGQNRGRINATQARIAHTDAARYAERSRIETSLFALHQELNHSLHVVHAYRDDIIPRLQRAAQETRRAYDVGRYSFLEWQTLQQELLNAQGAIIDASVDAHLNHIEIERLTGTSAATHSPQ